MAALTWLGHAAFLLESDDGQADLRRPVADRQPEGSAPGADSPERVDVIALTHGHGDHVGDTVALSQAFPEAEIVAQVELKGWLGGKGANVGAAARARTRAAPRRSTASASRS